MLDLQYICDHIDEVAENCRNRGVVYSYIGSGGIAVGGSADARMISSGAHGPTSVQPADKVIDFDALLKLRRRRGELISQIDDLRREQNEVSQQIPKEKDPQKKQTFIALGKELRQEVSQREAEL